MKNKVIRIEKFGGPDVLSLVETAMPKPNPDEVLIKHEAIGLNFIDIYFRSGLYPQLLNQVHKLFGLSLVKKYLMVT